MWRHQREWIKVNTRAPEQLNSSDLGARTRISEDSFCSFKAQGAVRGPESGAAVLRYN